MSVRVTTTGTSGAWHGAIRAGRVTLAECGHSHRNRDGGSDPAARPCAASLVRAARSEEVAARVIAERVAAAARARRLGARITDDEARAAAQATVAAWRTIVLEHDLHLPKPPGVYVATIACGCCHP
jgi:hypothetical protein